MTATRPVDSIKVGDRVRKDMGNLDSLATSIEQNGLIHPIVIRSDGTLIAGSRRLASYKKLGRSQIEVHVRDDIDSAVELLIAERDENTCREDFKPSEAVALGQKLEELEMPKAAERKAEAGKGNLPTSPGDSPPLTPKGETREKVGAAVGMSGSTYRKAKKVVESGDEEAIEEMDSTGIVEPSYRKVAPSDDTGRSRPRAYFGKGDKWQESTEPLTRYLAAWKKRDYEFAHVNPREASSRMTRIDNLIAGLKAARADLEPRGQKAKLTL